METVAKKKQRRRRSFTPEFKADIVEQCRKGDRSIGQVARDFDLTETAVREWCRQADIDDGQRPGLTSAERDELAELRRENRRLQFEAESLGGDDRPHVPLADVQEDVASDRSWAPVDPVGADLLPRQCEEFLVDVVEAAAEGEASPQAPEAGPEDL